MMQTLRRFSILLGIVILTMPVFAAETSESDSDESADEIIVTATYRETSLMDTAVSMTVISDDVAENMGAQSMEGLHTAVPGLTMTGSANGTNRYSIRGISSQSGENVYQLTGASVGVYLDNVPVTSAMGPNRQSNGVLFDIDRVEILKGPQGTLFGEGSQGGTIRFIYNQPDFSGFDYAFNTSVASMDEADDMAGRIDFMVNAPLSDNAALRLTGWTSATPGFIDNFNPVEEDINSSESNGVRATLLYEIDETLSLTATYHHSTQESDGAESTTEAFVSNAVRYPGVIPMSEDATDIFSLVIEKDLGWAQFTSISSSTERELSEIQEGPASTLAIFDFYYNGSGAPGTADHPYCAAGAAFGLCPGFPGLFNLTLGAGTTIGDGYNLQAANSYNDYISERKTQEFRLVSPADDRLRWTVGAFWKDSEEDIKSQQKAAYYPGRETVIKPLMDPLWVVPANTHVDSLEETAFFGELSYDIMDNLEATVGFRTSDLEQSFTTSTVGTDDSPTSEKFVLSWTASDDLLIYGSYASGFRIGNFDNGLLNSIQQYEGFAGTGPTTDALRQSLLFEGDELENVELGVKTTLMDGRVMIQASVYQMDWNDMIQLVANPLNPGQFYNDNSGGAEIDGGELDITAYVTDRLTMRLAADYNDSEVLSADGASFTELAYAPNDSIYVSMDYSFPMSNPWSVDLHLDFSEVAKQYSDVANTVVIPKYNLLNGRVTLRSPDQKWRVAMFSTNMAGKEIERGKDTLGNLYWFDPKQIGLEFGYNY